MKIRTILVTGALAIGLGGFALTEPASAAPPRCGQTYMTPVLLGSQSVEVSGEIACEDPNNPNDGRPLGVTLQQSNGGTLWKTVASGSGDALYRCVGTTVRNYRLRERSGTVVRLACG
jgi:hypothetical protein